MCVCAYRERERGNCFDDILTVSSILVDDDNDNASGHISEILLFLLSLSMPKKKKKKFRFRCRFSIRCHFDVVAKCCFAAQLEMAAFLLSSSSSSSKPKNILVVVVVVVKFNDVESITSRHFSAIYTPY